MLHVEDMHALLQKRYEVHIEPKLVRVHLGLSFEEFIWAFVLVEVVPNYF